MAGVGAYSNGLIGAPGYGGRKIKVDMLNFGLTIVGQTDDSRNGRAYYPNFVSSGSFNLNVIFPSWREYVDFGNWMIEYGKRAANSVDSTGPMIVIVPSVNFSKVGMPSTGITFGDYVAAVSYQMSIHFTGARDPITKGSALTSKFINVKTTVDPEAPFFYPAGFQLSGTDGIDTLYGSEVDPLIDEEAKFGDRGVSSGGGGKRF